MGKIDFFDLFKKFFGIVYGGIVLIVIFGGFLTDNNDVLFLSDLLLIVIATSVLIGIVYLYVLGNKIGFIFGKLNFDFDKAVILLSFLLFIWQCYFTYNIFFQTGWDVKYIVNSAQDIANGENAAYNRWYFSTYPNNLAMTYIQALLFKLNSLFGIFAGEYTAMCVVVVNCFINTVSCFLVFKTANLVTNKFTAFTSFCLAVFLFGISPWSCIPYSDALTLFVPILCIYLYFLPCKNKKCELRNQITSVAVSVICYFIKPTCIFAAIAIVVSEILKSVKNFSPKKLFRPILLCLAVFTVLLSSNMLLKSLNKDFNINLNENKEFSITHFLMMGANSETVGGYSGEDVAFSHSFNNTSERKSAEMKVFVKRIKKMNILKHCAKKMFKTFNDGTFAWSGEGDFYYHIPKILNTKASRFLKSFYYFNGKRYSYFATFEQFVWSITLVFSFSTAFISKNFKHKRELTVIWILLLGFAVYELLFEVRARYLYIFAPVFCVTAIIGAENTIKFLTEKLNHNKYRRVKI